jgi:ATP-dependent helicase/nuclease subunit B
VQIRFLLGPAGSGKTFRCLGEIRRELLSAPEGAPLILLAPKQATFQLERQLLENVPQQGNVRPLQGYTRLHILSFERLAGFVFDRLGAFHPELLGEQGRIMVLRALLERKRPDLNLFHASARLPGFARQLSLLLRELQEYHLTPARLESLAATVDAANHLDAKLRDLALILRAYFDWLKLHRLEDGDRLLDLAADALENSSRSQEPGARSQEPGEFAIRNSPFEIGGLWLDGFAQMTPQERRLLAAVTRHSARCLLAFCLDGEPKEETPWHSIWAPVGDTFLRCREELGALPGAETQTEVLSRDPGRSRFEEPQLATLERDWGSEARRATCDVGSATGAAQPGVEIPASRIPHHGSAIRVIACADPDAEVECIAHEIRRHIREENGRFHQVAVLVRSLEPYHDAIRRIFTRHEIPFFLDRRESVAHHPLAELTRCALRIVARGWEHEDWFAALKTGLVDDDDAGIDRLENETLARGWHGKGLWLNPITIPGSPELSGWVEERRRRLVPAFRHFGDSMAAAGRSPNGAQLRAAVDDLWRELDVEQKLERWSVAAETGSAGEPSPITTRRSPIHATVWEQMTEWLRNLELAFSEECLPLNDWLPVIEAGLGDLSVGVIPPALDQVLVGAIDRSRNPDLQIAFIAGANEGVFPAPPTAPALLSRADREVLAAHRVPVGQDFYRQMGLERYYGYIACTRPRRRLVLTYARRNARSQELNPSLFIDQLRRLVPALEVAEFGRAADWRQAEHWSELIVPCLRDNIFAAQPSLAAAVPGIQPILDKWRRLAGTRNDEKLPPDLVEKLYGPELRTSVSGLEDFAACPFKFLAGRGLRAEERMEFEVDPRERGSFQHEVLKEFHLRLQQEGKRWRDMSPADARKQVREAGEALLPGFRGGLFNAGESRRFTAQLLIEGLERLVAILVLWAKQYEFDPARVETGFGLERDGLPAWRIDVDGRHALLLRGRIDRIDLCPIPETGEMLGVVIDYKSGPRRLDPVLLQHGLELQLLAYLGALEAFESLGRELKASRILPAGAFYVALNGAGGSAKTRDEEGEDREEARRLGCQHRGRFDAGRLEQFDSRGVAKGDQFKFARNKDGSLARRGNEALTSGEFHALLRRIEEFLRQHGRAVYAGETGVSPYRLRNETACDFCLYRPVCRFDPWTQPYRVLRPIEEEA